MGAFAATMAVLLWSKHTWGFKSCSSPHSCHLTPLPSVQTDCGGLDRDHDHQVCGFRVRGHTLALGPKPSCLQDSQRLASRSQVQLSAEVSHVLSSMGMAHTVNALIENELLVVDIAVPSQPGQQPLALVLERPSDFSRNMPFRPLGATLLRWRLLLSCNWKVRL